jgi:hypothetical protein
MLLALLSSDALNETGTIPLDRTLDSTGNVRWADQKKRNGPFGPDDTVE